MQRQRREGDAWKMQVVVMVVECALSRRSQRGDEFRLIESKLRRSGCCKVIIRYFYPIVAMATVLLGELRLRDERGARILDCESNVNVNNLIVKQHLSVSVMWAVRDMSCLK